MFKTFSSKKTISIGFFGEAMVEMSGTPFKMSYGGDVLNTAVYLSRLIRGANKFGSKQVEIHFVSATGDDDLSQSLLSQWQNEGISTQFTPSLPGKSLGLYIVQAQENGERTFSYWRNDSAIRSYSCDIETPFESALTEFEFDIAYLSGISLAVLNHGQRTRLIAKLTSFKANGGKIIFDNNYRDKLWSVNEAYNWYIKILKLTDVAFLTNDDEKQVFGSDDPETIFARLQDYGISEVVIKRGAEPCVIYSAGGYQMVAGELLDKIEDTCAAGDSFAAGYLSKRLFGESIEQAAVAGHQLAARVLQHPGAIMPIEEMYK